MFDDGCLMFSTNDDGHGDVNVKVCIYPSNEWKSNEPSVSCSGRSAPENYRAGGAPMGENWQVESRLE